MIVAAALGAAVFAVLLGLTAGSSSAAVPSGFVTRTGTQLELEGEPYRFTGMNIYNANNATGCWYQMASGQTLEDSLAAISPSGGPKVIRAWFFQALSTVGGQRDWSGFDHTLSVAASRGVKVVVTLENQWNHCSGAGGGAGVFKNKAWYDSGYTNVDPGLLESYRDYVAAIVTRYKDDPTILAWQLMNEAETADSYTEDANGGLVVGPCSLDAGAVLRAWAQNVSGLIKSIDPNHLVSIGTIGSGQCGAGSRDEYRDLHSLLTVDLCEFHDYNSPADPMPGSVYNGLQDRLNQCNAIGKPLFVGETGIRLDQAEGSVQKRANFFAAKFAAQFAAGVVGILAWNWSKDGPSPAHDIGPGDPVLSLLDAYRDGFVTPALFHKVVVGDVPMSAAVDSGLGRAYVVSFGGKSLSIVDLPTRQVVSTVSLPLSYPWAVVVDPITHLVYVGDRGQSGGLSVVDGVTGLVLDTIALGDLVRDLGINVADRRLYALVVDFDDVSPERLQTWDLTDGDLVRDENVPTPTNGTVRLAAEGLGGYVWTVDAFGNVYEIDPVSGATNAGPIATGTSACCSSGNVSDIAIDPIHHLVYATRNAHSTYDHGVLTVIDESTGQTIGGELTLGDEPSHMAVDEANARVYVVNGDSHYVSVVQATSDWVSVPRVVNFTVANPVYGATYPGVPAFDPARNLLVVPDQYGSPAYGPLVFFGDPTDDADADGLLDLIDADGGTGTAPVGSFLDWTGDAPRPVTRGFTYSKPASAIVTYTDAMDPQGVKIAVSGSGTLDTRQCGNFKVKIPAGMTYTSTCKSLYIEDVTGPGTLEVISESDNLSVFLRAGDEMELAETPTGDFTVTEVVGSPTLSVDGGPTVTLTEGTEVSGSWAWTFVGFSSPVDNMPVVNVAKAGSAIPLKWRLLDANGQPVTTLASAKVTVVARSCDLGSTDDLIEETAASSSGLQNLGNGYYQYNWKTLTSYARSCKTLRLNLGEGFTHDAFFDFTK